MSDKIKDYIGECGYDGDDACPRDNLFAALDAERAEHAKEVEELIRRNTALLADAEARKGLCDRYEELILKERAEHEEVFEDLCEEIVELDKQLENEKPQSLEVREVLDELARACVKFPWWPTDPIHAAAIVAEEAGELVKDALQMVYEPDKPHNIAKEAIQTAAMALRFLLSINDYKTIKSEQLFDYARQRIAELEAQLQEEQPCK